ncbi:MAG: lipid-A-disaccharide synthase [Terriglobales bacterium]
MQILISAGEASGEMYGAQLIEALRRRDPSLTFFGAGGERMRAAGCDIVVDARDLAVVGITEIFSHLPKILGLYKKLIRAADERRPALAVVIDAPAFNWRVARQMRKRGIPVVYYVCPQFWAWRQGRVKLLRKYIKKALVIFPFEEKFYRDRGVDATFVGHPLADLPLPAISREDYAAQCALDHAKLDPAKECITLMPGSRRKEVRMNLPAILAAAKLLGTDYEFLLPVARTLEPAYLDKLIAAQTRQAASLRNIHLVPDAPPALQHSRAAIVASGTATVEAALMQTPFVMVYRVSPLTYALGKPRVKVPYYAMVNLIAGERVVPELVQANFTAENVVAELAKIIPDGPAREKMIRGLQSVRGKLKMTDGERYPAGAPAEESAEGPADRAASLIMGMLAGRM